MFLVFISLIFAALLIFNKKIMIKKRLEKAAKFILLCFLGALVYSCSPDDGKDGLGFEEMTKYGSITTTISGKLKDGKNFEKTHIFKFSHVNGFGSRVSKSDGKIYFGLLRLEDTFVYGSATINVGLVLDATGAVNEETSLYNNFENLNLMSDGSLALLDKSFDTDDMNGLKIENYSYDNTTKKLKFSFSYTVAANNNDTENILTVRGLVDVVVLEDIIPRA